MSTPHFGHDESSRRKQLTLLWMQAQPVVSAYISAGVRDRQHAEDLLQDTALSVAESFDQYDPARPFQAWAIGIARNKLMGFYRRNTRDRLVFNDELLTQIGSRFEAKAEAYKQQQSMLERCMARLAETALKMIKMRYIGEKSYEQIAQEVGRSPAGVANNLYRSRQALADCVKQELVREQEGRA